MSKVAALRNDSDKNKPLRLGERLLRGDFITQDELQIALHEQRRGGERLGATLVKLGFINDEILANALAAHTGRDAVELKNIDIDPEAMRRLPRLVAERCRAAPVAFDGNVLHLAMADPHDIKALDEVRRYFPRQIEIVPLIAAETAILDAIDAHARTNVDFDAILSELEGVAATLAQEGEAWQHPVIRLVNNILTDAVREGASDIHLEPENSFVRLRVRVDGVLRQKHALHRSHWPELSHRLKIMAGMNIADTRSMQDGRFHMQIGSADIDFRMAVMPTVQGENIVIRILDHRRALLPLEKLGYDAKALTQLDGILERPEGVVLVTGPTGSGKTTTLYAMLKRLSTVEVNIMTLEEPVEYQFEMIRQTAIQEQQGLTFAEGVRGILRQAPDIIFVGEVRDDDTARMALRAAMTGHQVFTTLHCNDVFGALPRLNDLGLSSRIMAENISGIVAQRLVRKLCPKCKRARTATVQEMEILRGAKTSPPTGGRRLGEGGDCGYIPHPPLTPTLSPQEGGEGVRAALCNKEFAEAQISIDAPLMIAEAKGCDHCNQTGYRGRCAVTEILRITPQMDELIANDAPQSALRKQAAYEGFRPMSADGIAKVLRQETSLDELRRNVDMTRIGQSSF
ncbi:MAG: GspE/PulE family protein [Alphaproteobacteria bacterium]|nr:GspE/PulE family protein [Alphaproteobacteria bacterium]